MVGTITESVRCLLLLNVLCQLVIQASVLLITCTHNFVWLPTSEHTCRNAGAIILQMSDL